MFLKVFLRRLFTFLPTILGIATFAFILGHATPGDPAYAALGIDLEGYSGVDQEESILVLFPDCHEKKHREILFLKE